MKNWRTIEHTADLAVEGWGDTPEEALAHACEGFLAQITDSSAVRPVETRRLHAEGVDREDAVVSFFGELVYTIFAQRWLPAKFRVLELTDTRVEVECAGEARDPLRHPLTEVKAATFHNFGFAKDAEGVWRLAVLFDV
jgi:SHS2 domain-containing protein